MRFLSLSAGLLLFVSASLLVSASEMAVPVSIKEVAKLRQGALVQVQGHVRLKKQDDFQLESLDGGKKIDLDFSQSTVAPEAYGLEQAGSERIPIEAVGRVNHTKGKDTLDVIGYFRLSPSP